jgi:hypothetical protein
MSLKFISWTTVRPSTLIEMYCSVYSCCYGMIARWTSVLRPVSRQRLGKHVPAAMVTHATVGNGVLSTRSAQRSYKEEN